MSSALSPGDRFEIIDRISPYAIDNVLAAVTRGDTDDLAREIMFTTSPVSIGSDDDDPGIVMIRFCFEEKDGFTGIRTHRLKGHLIGHPRIKLRVDYGPLGYAGQIGDYGFVEVTEA